MKEYTLSLFGLVHVTTSVVIEAESSEDAYEKAIRLNTELFERVQQAQQAQAVAQKSAQLNRAAKAARAAAVSVRSSTPGTNTAPKAQDRRSLLSEQFDGLMDRV